MTCATTNPRILLLIVSECPETVTRQNHWLEGLEGLHYSGLTNPGQ
jgi:hypothetical protein